LGAPPGLVLASSVSFASIQRQLRMQMDRNVRGVRLSVSVKMAKRRRGWARILHGLADNLRRACQARLSCKKKQERNRVYLHPPLHLPRQGTVARRHAVRRRWPAPRSSPLAYAQILAALHPLIPIDLTYSASYCTYLTYAASYCSYLTNVSEKSGKKSVNKGFRGQGTYRSDPSLPSTAAML
jgi:hypothetical protein